MLINEVAKMCDVTKKAIQYYVSQGVITPTVLENGYSDFSEEDVNLLKKVVLYRRLGLSVPEIKRVLQDQNDVKEILYQRVLELEREKVKQGILRQLSEGVDIEDLTKDINQIDANTIIIRRLLDLFPSYYGKFISLNFARYLTGTIETEEQMEAFGDIIEFFDNVPDFDIPSDLQEFMDEQLELYSSDEGVKKINAIIQGKHDAMKDINAFVKENKEVLDEYTRFKQSEEYKNSPAYRMMELMKEFCATSGYYDVFIPAMRKLSPMYNEYYEQMLVANEKFIREHPEYVK